MTSDKKKSPAKKKSPQKKKNKDKKSKKGSKKGAVSSSLAKICFAIAVSDLLHALYFTIQTMILLIHKFSMFAMLALLGVIFWVVIVVMLIVGLWKRKASLVRFWLIFSLAGFITDVLFLLWGIATSITVDWDRLQEFSIVFFGIFIESTCIYLIHRYYQTMGEKHKEKRPLCPCSGNSDKKKSKKKHAKK